MKGQTDTRKISRQDLCREYTTLAYGTYHHLANGTSLSIKNKQHRYRVCIASIYIYMNKTRKKKRTLSSNRAQIILALLTAKIRHKKNINNTNGSLESLTNYIKRRSFSVPADYNNGPMLYFSFNSLFKWHGGPLNGQVN